MIEAWQAEGRGRISFEKVYKDVLSRVDPRAVAKFQHLIDEFNSDADSIHIMLIDYLSLRMSNAVEYQKMLTQNKFITEAYSGFVDDNRVTSYSYFSSYLSSVYIPILCHFSRTTSTNIFGFIRTHTSQCHNSITSNVTFNFVRTPLLLFFLRVFTRCTNDQGSTKTQAMTNNRTFLF